MPMPLAEELRATLVVPESEPLVGRWRQKYDPPAPVGIPAHITRLFPFRPVRWLGEGAVADLAALIRAEPAAQFSLARVGRFPRIVYLAPEPAQPFISLTKRLAARFDLMPYGRGDGGGTPHLTVARHDDLGVLDRIVDALSPSLPLPFTLREAWLMERDDAGYWHRGKTFPFGP